MQPCIRAQAHSTSHQSFGHNDDEKLALKCLLLEHQPTTLLHSCAAHWARSSDGIVSTQYCYEHRHHSTEDQFFQCHQCGGVRRCAPHVLVHIRNRSFLGGGCGLYGALLHSHVCNYRGIPPVLLAPQLQNGPSVSICHGICRRKRCSKRTALVGCASPSSSPSLR